MVLFGDSCFDMVYMGWWYVYCDKICVYDEHPIAGRDIQYQAPDSWSEYTTPFDVIIK